VNSDVMVLPDEQQFVDDFQAINKFQQTVHRNMVEGQDYGKIPGTNKPTLLKPGAEKIAKLLGLADTYDIVNQGEDWGKGFFRYMVKCTLVHINTGKTVSEGLGECNSMESKYRWRWVWPDEVPANVDKTTLQKKTGTSKYGKPYTQYRMENDDVYSVVNTILKMAKKRALVDAALSAGRLSNVFTQDVEDMAKATQPTPAAKTASKPATKPKTTAEAKTEPQKANGVGIKPSTPGEFFAWLQKRDKEFTPTWFYRNFPNYTADSLKDTANIKAAMAEVEQLA